MTDAPLLRFDRRVTVLVRPNTLEATSETIRLLRDANLIFADQNTLVTASGNHIDSECMRALMGRVARYYVQEGKRWVRIEPPEEIAGRILSFYPRDLPFKPLHEEGDGWFR
jgi:hypothetical protein